MCHFSVERGGGRTQQNEPREKNNGGRRGYGGRGEEIMQEREKERIRAGWPARVRSAAPCRPPGGRSAGGRPTGAHHADRPLPPPSRRGTTNHRPPRGCPACSRPPDSRSACCGPTGLSRPAVGRRCIIFVNSFFAYYFCNLKKCII